MSTLQQAQESLSKLEDAQSNVDFYEKQLARRGPSQGMLDEFLNGNPVTDYNFAVRRFNEALDVYDTAVSNLPPAYRNQLLSCAQDFGTLGRVIRQLIAKENGQSTAEVEFEYLIGRLQARRNHVPTQTYVNNEVGVRINLRGQNPSTVHVTQKYADKWRISWDAHRDGTYSKAHWTYEGRLDDLPRKSMFSAKPIGKPEDAVFGEAHREG